MKTSLLFLLVMLGSLGFAQDKKFKLVSYNSLRYSPTNIDARHPDLRLIMNDLQPDILCVQELSGLPAAQMYMDSVLNVDSTTYSMTSFIDGNDLDVSLYYKTTKFNALPTNSHPTALRDIYQFQLIPTGIQDTLHVFGLHLKASSGSANQQLRKAEVDVLRQVTDQFAPGINFIVCGDFNIYSSNEPAYTRLLEDTPNNDGHFVDQLTLTGTWNNAVYAPYHTQSPRTTQFNGGANGGMDDRFDMILMSEALDDTVGLHYVSGSMLAYGNDGLHYNNAINAAPTNTAVGQSMADALHYGSDHIPIVATFAYTIPNNTNTIERPVTSVEIFNTPNGILINNPDNRELDVSIYSTDGRQVLKERINQTKTIQLIKKGIYIATVLEASRQSVFKKVVFK